MGLQIDADIRGEGGPWEPPLVGDSYARIQACGASFGRGIFKFHDAVSGTKALEYVAEAFPQLAAQPFAFDWLGRQYCVVAASLTQSGQAEVVVLDPFDMSILSVVHREEFLGFLASPIMLDLVENALFAEWLAAAGVESVGYDVCASANHPAFLGGERTVSNLEECDIEVYWSIMTQVAQATGVLADGGQQ